MQEDESYLNKRGLTHFWENIDALKQDKLTAGANITIASDNTISASQPTVNNATLTIQKEGTSVGTFTANASTNSTVNIIETDPTVPAWAKASSKPTYTWTEITNRPTNVSAFTNDAGYLTSVPTATTNSLGVVQVGSGLAISSGGVLSATGGGTADDVAWGHITGTMADQTDLTNALAAKADSSSLAAVATSGSYNDLTNKPTIGNATLTIQKNGTSAGTFTANATSNKSINITVPTTAADVSALPASTKYGASIAVSINTTDYKVTTTLKDQDGNTLGTAQVIDLPLESVVVNGSYDSTNKKIVLTLQSGSTIDIPVADLVAGLQSEITAQNMLSSDLVDDTNHTHKFVTAAQITKLNGIATGAEVNQNAFSNIKVGSTTVAADAKTDTLELVAGSNVTLTPDATNDKVTIAATDTTYSDATTSAHGLMSAADKTKLNGIASGAEVNVQSDWNQTTTTADDYIKNKPSLATVATSGSYNDLSNKPTIPAAQVQSNWTQTTTTAVDYIKNKPTLATVATSGSYNDLSNKPTIPTVNNATLTIQKNGANVQTFTANQSTNATANITVPTKTSDITNDSGYITSSSLNSYLPLAGGTMTGATYGYFPATASTMVGNEYNILLNGGDRYTLTQSGTGTLTETQVKGLFDGALAPQYSSNGVDPNDPYVLLIEGLPNVHTQTGGVFGWTCRYWVPTHFKVEFYDSYNSRGWVTAVEKTNTPTKELFVDIYRTLHGGAYTKIRITIYDSNGEVGANGHRKWGISEIFFCHPEAITPYEYANVNKANTATKATQDASGNVITTTYAKKTEIPTVNNGQLTIQKNGSNVATFTANQSGNATANIVTDELQRKSDTRSSMRPSDAYSSRATLHFSTVGAFDTQTQTGGYADALVLNSWNNDSGGRVNALVATKQNDQKLYHYTGTYNGSSWSGKKEVAYTDVAQEFAIGQGSTNPVFDDMTPVKTIEWDVSDTTYRPIYQMANTGWTYINMDITVAYRITVTGTNIHSITDVVDRWFSPASYPLTSMVCRTLSNSAATTGLKYLRAVYPTSSYVNNASYPLGVEVEMHNTTARHIKVEVFKDNSQVTWNATKPSGSIYVNSTYNGNRNLEVYATRGWRFHQPSQMYANSAGQASYVADFEAANIAAGELKTGATALVAGHYAFLADDGFVYDISDTTHNIAMGESKVGFMNSAVAANTAISWTYWRTISRPSATQVNYIPHDTLALGNRVFLRCTIDSSGNIHSDNYLSTTMSPNYTWMPFGWARSTSQVYVDTRFPMFYTLDSSGKLSHINGKAVAGTTYTAGSHINISGSTISAKDYVHSENPVSTSSVTPIVTGSMITNGTITADKLAAGATIQLTLSTSDIGEGAALAANTLYGVYL